MDKSRSYLEVKVGLFVAVGIILLAVILLQFSKGTDAFRGTYNVKLVASNVGGLKERAQVLLAGVQVGVVKGVKLAPDDKSVTITLEVYKDFPIYSDARFVIEQAGFLGDQFVSVIPTDNSGTILTNNTTVYCQEPFDLQEVARSAAGFINRLDGTAKKLDASITDLRAQVLNAQTLSNVGIALTNIRVFTVEALGAVSNVNNLIVNDGSQASVAVTNFVHFSTQLDRLGTSAQNLLDSNGTNISVATKNLADTSVSLKQITADVQAGHGLAGAVLQNQEMATNVMDIAANLSITTSNLNRHGLWGILWSHKPPSSESDTNKYTGLKASGK